MHLTFIELDRILTAATNAMSATSKERFEEILESDGFRNFKYYAPEENIDHIWYTALQILEHGAWTPDDFERERVCGVWNASFRKESMQVCQKYWKSLSLPSDPRNETLKRMRRTHTQWVKTPTHTVDLVRSDGRVSRGTHIYNTLMNIHVRLNDSHREISKHVMFAFAVESDR